jgi:N-acetylmuramoyl-L-alanine amidase
LEKVKIHIWFLIFFPLWIFSLQAEEAKIQTLGKNQYVPLSEFLSFFPDVLWDTNPVTRVTSVQYQAKEMRFLQGGAFYTFQNKIEKLTYPPLEKDGQIVIPPDLVEALLMHIIMNNIEYEYSNSELILRDKGSVISGEQISSIKAIIIDAGHGGKDPGTMEPTGVQEKDVTLTMARLLKKYLNRKYPDIKVHLTRAGDQFIALDERSRIANELKQKLKDTIFVSLHCNSSLMETANGFEIYYLSQSASTEQSRELAIIENKYIDSNYPTPVKKIESGMMSSQIQRSSRKLAVHIERSLSSGLSPTIPNRGVKKADFAVLRGSLMPAVLVEMGYLSNRKEKDIMMTKEFKIEFIKSLAKGILAFSQTND